MNKVTAELKKYHGSATVAADANIKTYNCLITVVIHQETSRTNLKVCYRQIKGESGHK